MKRWILRFVLIAFVALLYYGCEKPKTYSDIPSIQFVSLSKERSISGPDSVTIITVSFTDGDGDIGYQPSGNGAILDSAYLNGKPNLYYHDFIVSFFQKENGIWVEDTAVEQCDSCAGFSGRLPYLTPTGSNKALSGEISMSQLIQLTQLYRVQNDTIHYQVYIFDRALHKSNVITTSDIVVSIE